MCREICRFDHSGLPYISSADHLCHKLLSVNTNSLVNVAVSQFWRCCPG